MKWVKVAKIKYKGINHFKTNFCMAGRKTQNAKKLYADLLLSSITQLIKQYY